MKEEICAWVKSIDRFFEPCYSTECGHFTSIGPSWGNYVCGYCGKKVVIDGDDDE